MPNKRTLPGVPPVAVAGGQMAIVTLLTLPLLAASFPDHAPSLKAAASLVALGAASWLGGWRASGGAPTRRCLGI